MLTLGYFCSLKKVPMDVRIRPATKNDAAAILALIQELALFEKEPQAVVLTQADIEAHGFGPQPLFQCLVAEPKHKYWEWHYFTQGIRHGKDPPCIWKTSSSKKPTKARE